MRPDLSCANCGKPMELRVQARLWGTADGVRIQDGQIQTGQPDWEAPACADDIQPMALSCSCGLELDLYDLKGHPKPGERMLEVLKWAREHLKPKMASA